MTRVRPPKDCSINVPLLPRLVAVRCAGVANGLTSFDIGVFEPASTAIGSSLGMIGIGVIVATVGLGDTPGDVNVGQTIP